MDIPLAQTKLDVIQRSVNENESIPVVKEATIIEPKKRNSLKSSIDSSDSSSDSSKSSWKQLIEHDSSDEDIPLSKIVKMKKKKADLNSSGTVQYSDKSDVTQSTSNLTDSIFGNKRPLSMFEKLQASCSQKEISNKRLDSPTKLLNLKICKPQSSSDTSPSEEDLPAIFSSPIKSKQQIANRTKEILLAASGNIKTAQRSVKSDDENQGVKCIQQPPISPPLISKIPIVKTSIAKEPVSKEPITKVSVPKFPISTLSTSASDKNSSRVSSLRSFTEQFDDVATESYNNESEISSEIFNVIKLTPVTNESKTKKGRKKHGKSIESTNTKEVILPIKSDKKKPKKKKKATEVKPIEKATETKSTQKPASKRKKDSIKVTPSNDDLLAKSITEDPVGTTMLSLDDTNELLDRLEQQDSSLAETSTDQTTSPLKTSLSSKSLKVRPVSVKVKNIQTRSRSKKISKKQTKSQVKSSKHFLVLNFVLLFFCFIRSISVCDHYTLY